MAPVVRISDDVFRRLQRISEPLVDTPSQVIDRILAFYERTATSQADAQRAEHVVPSTSVALQNADVATDTRLFIAPASEANLNRTVLSGIAVSSVESFLTPAQLSELRAALGTLSSFNCWALTESRRPVFDSMRMNDVVVLITPQTAFTGRIQHRLISERLGNHLWASQPRLPWKYIYLLSDIRERHIRKDMLSRALGYKETHAFPGVSRVRPEALRKALDAHGSIEALLQACA